MAWLPRALLRFRFLLTGRRIADESAEELHQHLELLTSRYEEQGMPPAAARAQAQRQLGNVSLVREDIYWMTRIRWWDTLQQDVRHALRVLWRAKAFTAAAVLILTLGVAATTTMFSLIHGVLLRPLPVHDQDRLIVAWREARTTESAQYPFGNLEIEAVARTSRLLESTAGVTRNGVQRAVVTDGGTATYANVGLVTGGFFDVLGASALVGRALSVTDDRDGAEPVIVISHGYWRRRYGAASDVIGRRVAIAEQPFAIVGVMPPDLDYPQGVDIWRPTTSVPTNGPFGDAAQREVNLIGRLRPGVTVGQASSELAALNERLTAEAATDYLRRGLTIVVRPFTQVVIGDARGTLLALFGAVGLLMLIASANVANLLLMRGERRRAEWALRAALGAGRRRIVGQIFAESLVLSVAAGTAGIVLAWLALPALLALVPDGLPRVESIRIDATVASFSVGVVFVTALLAGIAPGWFSARGDLVSPLRSGSLAIAGPSSNRGRQTLAVAQVALAVIVVAAAGLLIRSILNLHAIDLGLPAERLAIISLYMPPERYADRDRRAQFLDAAMSTLEAVPTLLAVTPVNVPPFSDRGWDVPRVAAEGQSADGAARNPSLNLESIHPNYFSTMGVPIVRGRAFTGTDRQDTVPVAILSEDAASRLWPHDDPVGKRLKMGGADSQGRWLEVVGIAAQTRYRTVTTPRPTLYLPAAQFQMTATMLVARSTAPLELLTSVARERIHGVDPDVQVMTVAPFTEFLDRPLARPRFRAFLIGMFGIAALLLSALGLYAVVAANVRQRDREIAVRLALGATALGVRRLFLKEAGRLAGLGALLGLCGAITATTFLQGMLFGIDPLDPTTMVGAATALVGAAALAAYVAVRGATRADIVTVLRSQ